MANLFFSNNNVCSELFLNRGSIDGHIVHLNVEIHLDCIGDVQRNSVGAVLEILQKGMK